MLTTNAEQKLLLIGMTDIPFQDPRNFPNGLRIIVRAVACDVVPFEKIDIESITEERRKSVAKSVRIASVEELKKLGDEVFPDLDDPWRETYFQFIAEHSHATIHHAVASDGVHMLYCRDEDRGIWFVPGTGKGILSPAGRQMMREAIEGRS